MKEHKYRIGQYVIFNWDGVDYLARIHNYNPYGGYDYELKFKNSTGFTHNNKGNKIIVIHDDGAKTITDKPCFYFVIEDDIALFKGYISPHNMISMGIEDKQAEPVDDLDNWV